MRCLTAFVFVDKYAPDRYSVDGESSLRCFSRAAALEELGQRDAAVALLGEAIARYDVWLVQFPRIARYDKLRKDPRAAAMLDKLGKR